MPTKKRTNEQKTAIQAQRTSSDYVIDPEDLYVETNPQHPLYDPRWTLEVTPEQIETWQLAGQAKDIVCRKNGDRIEVVDGLQTLKTALKINEAREAEGAEPIQVRIALRSLPTNAAVLVFREVSNRRRASLPTMVARQAATMLGQGVPRESVIVAIEGIGDEKTLRRLLALHELSPEVQLAVDEGALKVAEAVRVFSPTRLEDQPARLAAYLTDGAPPRAPADRTRVFPSIDVVRRVHAKSGTAEMMHPQAQAVLGWVAGKVTQEQLLTAHPALAAAFAQ